jgi:hypothetical protein
MAAPFDVFRRDSKGKSIWLTTTEDFDEAQEFINRLDEESAGLYFIYSRERGTVSEVSAKWADVT